MYDSTVGNVGNVRECMRYRGSVEEKRGAAEVENYGRSIVSRSTTTYAIKRQQINVIRSLAHKRLPFPGSSGVMLSKSFVPIVGLQRPKI
jgi:hypothetical protein